MAEDVSEIEEFSALFANFIGLVEYITQQRVEPRLQEVSLPAEYRWDADTNTQYLLDHPLAPFSANERADIEGFVAAVRAVPAMAPELSDGAWKKAQVAGQQLLSMLRSHQQSLPDQR